MDQIVDYAATDYRNSDFSGFPHFLLRDLCKEYEMYQYLEFFYRSGSFM